MNKNDEEYKIFKQVLHTFYHNDYETEGTNQLNNGSHNIKIEPTIVYAPFQKTLKIEFKIGNKQLYKLKSLPEFYERMLKNEVYKYGTKLEFEHNREAFRKEDLPLLDYILKYAEIIKYANETINGVYGKYGRTMSDEYITVSNSGLDELFDALEGQRVLIKRDFVDKTILLVNQEPDIKFILEEMENEDYRITTNIDVFSYDILEGKNYIYFMTNDELYRCSKKMQDTVLKFLQIYRNNYISEVKFKKEELPSFCSLIYPNFKEQISLEKIKEEIIDKYIPKKLYVKLFLDFNEKNYIVADMKFAYGNLEFNPLLEQKVEIPRDIAKENEYLNLFIKSGFQLDKANARLVLAKEEDIYQFLSQDIEIYMSQFEVLATENFKKKEIKQPKMGTIGVKVENNLLKIDFSNIDFNIEELKSIMKKYKLKKKYHRLKDGSFLKLEENETMQFIDSITEGSDLDYQAIEKGEIHLPIYRTMYLDRLLQNLKNTNVSKNSEYKNLVGQIETREIDEEVVLPVNLNAQLRNYQKVGFKWLKALNHYGLGGILADDMGLRKNITNAIYNFIICRRRER